MLDFLFFGVLPYVAIVLFVFVSIVRYRQHPYSFSSLSSQFLETKQLFWGSVPFHTGVMILFFGHLIAFLVPSSIMAWNAVPVRLFILEACAMASALLMLWGIVNLLVRRFTNQRLIVCTTKADLLVYFLILWQVVTGLWTALGYRWGSSWFSQVLSPYLWSLLSFTPDVQRMSDMPLVVQFHVIGAFVFVGAFSFTRLVHFLVAPIPYLWRPFQLVIWNRRWRA